MPVSEHEKLLGVYDHRYFNGRRAETGRVLLDEESKKPSSKSGETTPAEATASEQQAAPSWAVRLKLA